MDVVAKSLEIFGLIIVLITIMIVTIIIVIAKIAVFDGGQKTNSLPI